MAQVITAPYAVVIGLIRRVRFISWQRYVILEDAWYIIPEKEIRGLKSISLCTTELGSEAKYEQYREAGRFCGKASEIGEAMMH